jgi:magnesium chelatase subunit I
VQDGGSVETGELVTSAEVLQQVGTVAGLAKVLERLGLGDAPSPGEAAAGVELVLEGLHLTRRLDTDTVAGRTVYGA